MLLKMNRKVVRHLLPLKKMTIYSKSDANYKYCLLYYILIKLYIFWYSMCLNKGELVFCRLKITGMISRQQNNQEGV